MFSVLGTFLLLDSDMIQGNLISLLSNIETDKTYRKYPMPYFYSQLHSTNNNTYRDYSFDKKLLTTTDVRRKNTLMK